MLARLAPVESAAGRLEGAAPAEALARLERRLDGLGDAQGATQAALAALKRDAAGPVTELAERLSRLTPQKEALAERLLARLAALEAELAARDPQAGARRHRRLARADRAAGGAGGEPVRRGRGAAGRAPRPEGRGDRGGARRGWRRWRRGSARWRAGLRCATRALDAVDARLEALRERIAVLETPGESPFAAVAAQLAGLHAQKDALAEGLLTRLAALEAEMAGRDPQGALDGFAARLEALRERIAGLETPGENPFAAVAAQLAGLHAQKDAATEAVLTRLAPLEARLGAVEAGLAGQDPRGALDGLAARLEAAQALREAAEAGLRERIALLETPGENPFAAVAAQLAELHAQKDALAEGLLTRFAALEAEVAARDPQGALDGLAARLEAAQALREAAEAGLRERVALLEAPGESPVAELAAQLAGLYAQKDAATEAVLTRLEETLRRIARAGGCRGALRRDLGAAEPALCPEGRFGRGARGAARGGGAGSRPAARGGRGRRRPGGRSRPRRGAGDRHAADRDAGGGGADRALRRPDRAPGSQPAAAERDPVADDAGAGAAGRRGAGGGRAGGGGSGRRLARRPAGGVPRPAADRLAAPEVNRRFRLRRQGFGRMERIWNAYGGTPAGNRGLTNSAEARRGTRRDGGS